MEFVRHDDKSFEWGVEKAAELGYEYVEPMLHWGRELLSEAGYFHSVSMLDDPLRIKRACDAAGIKLSGFSAHSPLCKPEISTEYLKQAVRFAAECGAPVVNTDEGPKQKSRAKSKLPAENNVPNGEKDNNFVEKKFVPTVSKAEFVSFRDEELFYQCFQFF